MVMRLVPGCALLLSTVELAAQAGAPAAGTAAAPSESAACRMGLHDESAGNGASVLSLEELIDQAALIVEASVQSATPGLARPPAAPIGSPFGGSLDVRPVSPVVETDARLVAERVLKGTLAAPEFAVSQLDAKGVYTLGPGRRFILFLVDEPAPRRKMLPALRGVPRYATTGGYSGLFCVDGTQVKVSGASILSEQYNDAPLDGTVAAIRAYVNARHVHGRIKVEGGKWPIPIDAATADSTNPRSDIHIAFTPASDEPTSWGMAPRPAAVLRDPRDVAVVSGARMARIRSNGSFDVPLDDTSYRASVRGLPFGYYVKSLSYGNVDLLTSVLDLHGQSGDSLEITLTDTPPAGASTGVQVTGWVTGPVEGAQLRLQLISENDQDARASRVVEAGADGRFEIDRVPPGPYSLRLRDYGSKPPGIAGETPGPTAVLVDDHDSTLSIPRFTGVEVTGYVLDRSRTLNRFAGLQVEFRPAADTSGSARAVITGADGAFRVWLLPGRYTVVSSVFMNAAALNCLDGAVDSQSVCTSALRGDPPVVKFMTSGSTDLLREPLTIDGWSPVDGWSPIPIAVTIE